MKAVNTAIEKKSPAKHVKDYCLTCRLPAKLCKGKCTLEERKKNGG